MLPMPQLASMDAACEPKAVGVNTARVFTQECDAKLHDLRRMATAGKSLSRDSATCELNDHTGQPTLRAAHFRLT